MQRLVRPTLVGRALRTSATLPRFSSQIRSLSSVLDHINTTQPAVREENIYAEPPVKESLISKWGWYPVAGLLGSVLVSKEILRVNEDIFLAINYALVVFCAYVGVGDQLAAEFRQDGVDDKKTFNDAADFELALLEEVIKVNTSIMAKPEVIQAYLSQYEAASAHYAKAQQLLVQLALRNSAEAKLVAVRDREIRQEREAKDKISRGARDWLLQKFQSSPQLKAAAIERALVNIGKSKNVVPVGQDPIKQLFREYLTQSKK